MSKEPGILPEPIPFGKYYLLERISVGGMAEIYKAKAFGVEGFERLLAVKKILSSIAEDESFIEMFIDEAKIAGQLNHPNIAQIYDLGKVEGSYYIALEYISGKDMKTIFERARRVGEEVDIPQVCHVVMKVCEGLAHAHNKTDSQGRDLNIVHRDISPQNILISYEGEVKIIDFGIAKAQGKTSQTQVGVLKGKFSYMSPEQVRGLHVDHRSDIFSLGIVLYELLTLERLFLGESDFDTLEKIRKVEMSPPSLYNPNIPKELEDIVLKALAQNPDDRFQSAGELAEALERFMRHEDYYYKNTDLAEFMKDAFNEDLEFEQKKLEYYQSLDLEPPEESGEEEEDTDEAGGLVWDEEEMETQIFDRDPEEQSGAHSPAGGAPAAGSGSHPAPSGSHPAPSGSQQAAPPSGEANAPTARDSQESGAVEVVGPDNKVDTIGPADEVEPVEEDPNDPTIEYDRVSVEDQLEELGADVDEPAPGEGDHGRRNETTSEVPAGARATGPQAPVEPRSGDTWKRVLVVGGTAALIMVVALGVVFGVSGGWGGNKAEIQFSTTPKNVQIVVDGEQVYDGETPFTYRAEPGPTEIAIKKEGYEPDERSRTLEAGTTYQLKANLEKIEGGTGEIFVKSEPSGAVVKVDGSAADDPTPVTVDKLEAGSHEVVVSKEGFAPAERNVELEKGESRELDVQLPPKSFALTVKSEPDGAEFEVRREEDDERVASGETPETVDELDGEHTYRVTFERSGYEDAEKKVEPGADSEMVVEAELERDEGRASGSAPSRVARRGTSSGGSPGGGPSRGSSGDSTSSSNEEPENSEDPGGGSEPSSSEPSGGDEGASEPEQNKPKGKGTLNINSRPAARVHIDGKDTGRHTPLLNYKVDAGKHQIVLKNEEFGLKKTYYVDLEPGETKKIINRSK